MRLLLVSHGYSESEKFKLPLALAAEHDVTLLAPARIWTVVYGDLDAPPSSGEVTVLANRTIALGRHFLFRPSWRTYRALRPDVIHVEYDPWTPEFWSAVLPLSLLYPRTPIVLFTKKNTRTVPSGVRGSFERGLTRLGLARVRLIIAASAKVRSMYAGMGFGHKAIVVQSHLALDGATFRPGALRPADDRDLVIGYVGGLMKRKGIVTLLRAVDLLRDRTGRNVTLELVAPVYDQELVPLVAAAPWATLHAPKSNAEVAAFLHTVDVFVMPSHVEPDHEEHDAHALLEAMASGLPCVASRSGIIPEIIDDDVHGLLVDPADAIGLSERLEALLVDPALRARLGVEARPRALQHSDLPSVVQQRLAAYQEVVGA